MLSNLIFKLISVHAHYIISYVGHSVTASTSVTYVPVLHLERVSKFIVILKEGSPYSPVYLYLLGSGGSQ